jgi:DNA damage-binding protein 2
MTREANPSSSKPLTRKQARDRPQYRSDDDQYAQEPDPPRQRLRLSRPAASAAPRSSSSSSCCRVCGARDHRAGFDPATATYRDCPRRPCYLCGSAAHVAHACPHRPAAQQDAATTAAACPVLPSLLARREASSAAASAATAAAAERLAARAHWPEVDENRAGGGLPGSWRVSAACLGLHDGGRVTCLAFPSSAGVGGNASHLVASGNRHGGVAVWDHQRAHGRETYPPGGIFDALVNCLEFPAAGDVGAALMGALPGVGVAGDGTVRAFDLETGARDTLLRLASTASSRGMLYSVRAAPAIGALVASDNRGQMHVLDGRVGTAGGGGGGGGGGAGGGGSGGAAVVATVRVHKRGAKVNAVAVAGLAAGGGMLVATGANDHTAKLLDLRRLSGGGEASAGSGSGDPHHPATLATLPHGGVVTHAAFWGGPSPSASRGLVTTCFDNRLRVWDEATALVGGGDNAGAEPSRTIVHSHNFMRHLSFFRAAPDPKAPSLAVIGRYLSEPFEVGGAVAAGGAATAAGGADAAAAPTTTTIPLHPVDVIDLRTGRLVAALADENLTTVPSVNAAHPSLDVVVTGSSRSVFAWRRRDGGEEEEEDGEGGRRRTGGGGVGGREDK